MKDCTVSCYSLLLSDSKSSEVSDHPVKEGSTEPLWSLADGWKPTALHCRGALWCLWVNEVVMSTPSPFSYASVAHLNVLFPLSTIHLLGTKPGVFSPVLAWGTAAEARWQHWGASRPWGCSALAAATPELQFVCSSCGCSEAAPASYGLLRDGAAATQAGGQSSCLGDGNIYLRLLLAGQSEAVQPDRMPT